MKSKKHVNALKYNCICCGRVVAHSRYTLERFHFESTIGIFRLCKNLHSDFKILHILQLFWSVHTTQQLEKIKQLPFHHNFQSSRKSFLLRKLSN